MKSCSFADLSDTINVDERRCDFALVDFRREFMGSNIAMTKLHAKFVLSGQKSGPSGSGCGKSIPGLQCNLGWQLPFSNDTAPSIGTYPAFAQNPVSKSAYGREIDNSHRDIQQIDGRWPTFQDLSVSGRQSPHSAIGSDPDLSALKIYYIAPYLEQDFAH